MVYLLGFHLSIAGKIEAVFDRAEKMQVNTFQCFTRNPRGWRFKELDPERVVAFRERLSSFSEGPVVAHMPYLPNLASPEEEIWEKSVYHFGVELERCSRLGIPYLITHLGSHKGKGLSIGKKQVVEAIRRGYTKKDLNEAPTTLLEIGAGGKNSVSSTFEDLADIIERLESLPIGVCFDTAHAFAAGYDLQEGSVNATMSSLDDIIGTDLVSVYHLNDSPFPLGSRRDRHEHIGEGKIGKGGIREFLQHEQVAGRPVILETPYKSEDDDIRNLRIARDLAGASNKVKC